MRQINNYKLLILCVGFSSIICLSLIMWNPHTASTIESPALTYLTLFSDDSLKCFETIKQAHVHVAFWRVEELHDALTAQRSPDSQYPVFFELEYTGLCNPDLRIEQLYDTKCFDPQLILQHSTNQKPALECCQLWGQKWHRSFVIYNKNSDPNKVLFPYWESVLQNSKLNPDLLPVVSAEAGYSDFQRGGSLYQNLVLSDARDRLDFFNAHEITNIIANAKSLIHMSDQFEMIYLETKLILPKCVVGTDDLLIGKCKLYQELFLSGELARLADMSSSLVNLYESGKLEQILENSRDLTGVTSPYAKEDKGVVQIIG